MSWQIPGAAHFQSGRDDRCRGALIGLAIGDALGAPVETMLAGSFRPITGFRSGGYFRLPAGAWTDDTAMALCLADSLAQTADFDAADLMRRFCRWARHGENTSTGLCIGAGKNTVRALAHFHRAGDIEAPAFNRFNDGNGALMRLAPVPIRYRNRSAMARRVARAQSRATHASPMSEACCAFTAVLVCRLVDSRPWQETVLDAAHKAQGLHGIAQCLNETAPPASSGYVLDTLRAALWAVSRSKDFREAVLMAVNLGGDADTVGAVAGQIAGARWGYQAIPDEWKAGVFQHDRLLAAADLLIARSNADEAPAGKPLHPEQVIAQSGEKE